MKKRADILMCSTILCKAIQELARESAEWPLLSYERERDRRCAGGDGWPRQITFSKVHGMIRSL